MKSTLKQANDLLLKGEFESAHKIYRQVLEEIPEMERFIKFNLTLAEKGIKSSSAQETVQCDYAVICKNLIALNPHHQVVRNPLDNFQWQSQGDDPYFLLDFDSKDLMTTGWYEVELCMHTSYKQSNVKFYFDTGMGFNEAEILIIAADTGNRCRRIFSFPKTVRAIRFDPMETEGSFLIETLRFDRISENQVRSGMLQHLIEHNSDLPGLSTDPDWQYIVAGAEPLNLGSIEYLIDRYNESFNPDPGSITYDKWIESVESPSLPTPKAAKDTLEKFICKPLISIVMPVYNTKDIFLRACIDSVLTQSYPHWELCIADDKSSKEDVRQVLQDYEQKDTRIRVVYRQENGHICHASNSALDMATGEYVAMVEHDDVLSEHALYFIAQAINEKPDAQILYSDEDKLDSKGQRFDPHFKSDWNPDLFYSQNYVSHLVIYRRELLRLIGGFRSGMEGSQDQDVLLRCLPHVQNAQIVHIPHVLYHWRAHERFTDMSSGERFYTTDAGAKALTEYFKKNGPAGIKIEAGLVPNSYRIRWPIPEPAPLVSLLIPTRDRKNIIEVAVRSILDKTTYNNYEIIILDNGSVEQEAIDWFTVIQQEDRRVKVLRYDHPFNYSAINNFGVQHAKGSLIGLINNDVEVISPDWLTEMVSHALREDIGCVGAKLYYGNNRIQHAGVILGIGGVASHPFSNFYRRSNGYFNRLKLVQNYSAVTAACILIKRDLYLTVGGLDEENLQVAYNDVDFCLKINKSGYRNIWTPYAELYHYESISRGSDQSGRNLDRFKNEREYMLQKWNVILEHDPYYNDNLTRNNNNFIFGAGFSRELNFENKIFYEWKSNKKLEAKRYACIFAAYDSNSRLHDYVAYYLEKIKKYFDIFYITTGEYTHRNPEAVDKLQSLCKAIIVRKNEGYDFGSWKLGIKKYYNNLKEYDGVLLANDSVYGPLYDLFKFLEKFENLNCDVLGMTDSNEVDYHLQSYFVIYKNKVINNPIFVNFWDNVAIQGEKWDIIKKYEIGLSQRLMRYCGYNLKAYCDMSDYPNVNHTHVHWRDLILKKQYPFIKIELIKKNPFDKDLSDLKEIVETLGYDFQLIKNHI